MKSLIIFNLDGLLTERKSDLDGGEIGDASRPVARDRRRGDHFRRRLRTI